MCKENQFLCSYSDVFNEENHPVMLQLLAGVSKSHQSPRWQLMVAAVFDLGGGVGLGGGGGGGHERPHLT